LENSVVAKHVRYRWLPALLAAAALFGGSDAMALECGSYSFPHCSGPQAQYAGGFNPGTGDGGFGGGSCRATKTPIVFIHGNGDRATGWDAPAGGSVRSVARRSVYDELKHRGYNDCELFGVTYLDEREQEHPEGNFHRPEKYRVIIDFIRAVKAYSGSQRVDLIAHSLGVSMTLASLQTHDGWSDVRRFINIAGGLRGLDSCLYTGPANPLAPTCGSENMLNHQIFGFYPNGNDWTGVGTKYSLREMPKRHREVSFYTIDAGANDQIHCAALRGTSDCSSGALFDHASNVRAQLNIGTGATTLTAAQGGDSDGVGHFNARNNAGTIIYTMLNTDCRGLNCKGSYRGPVRVQR
jgi:pimeloyl-ACP methyl ester carboxylesterase